MSGTISITPFIDTTGVHIPLFEDVQTFFINSFQTIYGADIYLGNDSQDGQLIGVFSQAYYDLCVFAVTVFNSFSPTSAQGTSLSRLVKINGIARLVASPSQVILLIGGTPGTEIINGYATDDNNNQWNFPAVVIIPISTQVSIDATCSVAGAVQAGPGSITGRGTPTRGWNSVTNIAAAIPGAPVETDPNLRIRQTESVAMPSQSIMDGMRGLVAAVPGVVASRGYENDTGSVDANGQPNHSVYFVVEGGDPVAVATAINLKKTTGAPTTGDTKVVIADAYGNPKTIWYWQRQEVPMQMAIVIEPVDNYVASTGDDVVEAVVTYGNALGIGATVFLNRLWVPANLAGVAESLSYNVVSIMICRLSGVLAAADVLIAFNEEPTFSSDNITLTVLTS